MYTWERLGTTGTTRVVSFTLYPRGFSVLSWGSVEEASLYVTLKTLGGGGFPSFARPWDSPSKNTGVGCHFLLQCMKV